MPFCISGSLHCSCFDLTAGTVSTVIQDIPEKSLRADSSPFSATCTQHPLYPPHQETSIEGHHVKLLFLFSLTNNMPILENSEK